VRNLAGIEQPQAKERERTPAQQEAPPAQVTPDPQPQQTISDKTDTSPASETNLTRESTAAETLPASPAPPGSKEFGAAASSNTPVGPAPAPVTGGGEFAP
jgi:hypothetical protein